MGTQIFLGNPPANVEQWIKNNYGPKLDEPLCFTAEAPGSTVGLTQVGSTLEVHLQTSTDGNTWTPYTVNDTITLANVGDKVYFKAKGRNQVMAAPGVEELTYFYNNFVMTGKIAASGNVNSLLEEDEETARTMSLSGKEFCYAFLFQNCASLTSAPELPATTLARSCYESMFNGCTSLTSAPELPATTLADYCYSGMFQNCTSLTQAPAIKTYTPELFAFYNTLNAFDYNTQTWGQLTSCNWSALTLSEAESMVLTEFIFGQDNPGASVRISITCKDGSGTAYYDTNKINWVFER